MTHFDEFDRIVSDSLKQALNGSPTMSKEMTRILCAVIFAGYELFPARRGERKEAKK